MSSEGERPQLRELSSILVSTPGHFQIDLDQAPRAIADFRHAAQALRDLMDDADILAANLNPPGLDAVSRNVVAEVGRWACGDEPGSLLSAMEQGSARLEEAADALERSLRAYRQTDEISAVNHRPLEL